MQGRRVAITGIGVVAPCGIGTDAFWQGLHEVPGESDMRAVEGFDPAPLFDNPKEARRSDRFAQFALAAAAEALAQAGDLGAAPDRVGTWIGTGVGGIETNEKEIVTQHVKGPRRVSPFLVPMMMANAASASVAMKYGFQGPSENTVTACAAGTHSLGRAADLISYGRADVMIAGGSEAPMTDTALAGFRNMTAMTKSGRSMPFDPDRDGFVIAEGAGILVLEAWDHAVARGATILAEFLGSASNADAHHITAPSPGGVGAIACMKAALADANIEAGDVTFVNAHGTSTPLNDAAEASAVAEVFGTDPGPAMNSIKGVTGHSLGAAGALEAVALVLSMQKASIPPTLGTKSIDPELAPVDIVFGEARSWEPAPAMSNSFGFGGHNGSLIIGPT